MHYRKLSLLLTLCLLTLASGFLPARATVYEAGEIDVQIPDNGDPINVPVEVRGESSPVYQVNVAFNIAHTFVSDLIVELVDPTGTPHTLWPEDFFGTFDNLPLYLSVPFPTGIDPNGIWYLRVQDVFVADVGTVFGFSVEIPENANRFEPLIGFYLDPLRAKRVVIADEAGRVSALATFRLNRSGFPIGLTSLVIVDARHTDPITVLFRNDGSVAQIKYAENKVAISRAKNQAVTVQLKRQRLGGTVSINEGAYSAAAEVLQTTQELGRTALVRISSDPVSYRDAAGDFIRATARSLSYAIGNIGAVLPIELGDPLQPLTAIAGSYSGLVDAYTSLDFGGRDLQDAISPMPNTLSTQQRLYDLVYLGTRFPDFALSDLNFTAQAVYPSLLKADPEILWTLNEPLDVFGATGAQLRTIWYNPYADGSFRPVVQFSYDHTPSGPDNTDISTERGYFFQTGFVPASGVTTLDFDLRDRTLILTTTPATGNTISFQHLIFANLEL